jgi:osmoprotectant transport system permease protein
VHFLVEVATWFSQATHWRGPNGIPTLLMHQLLLSIAVVGAALLVGGGTGLVLGHFRRGALLAVNSANAARAIPTLALLTLFAILPAISLTWNGFLASFLALVVLATPPILTNTYVGVREVEADVREAATAMGMHGGQVMLGVELPLALPVLATGVRVAAIEVIATSTLAAYVSYSDLGTYVISGLDTNDTVEAFCGGLLVALSAALVAVAFGHLQRLLTPAPLRRGSPVLAHAGTRARSGT